MNFGDVTKKTRVDLLPRHRGVKIGAIILEDAAHAEALARVRAAIDVLANVWPRQVERLPRFVAAIVVIRTPGAIGLWQHKPRAIFLDRDFVLRPATSLEYIASVIVHELTHARLYRAGLQSKRENRVRCERICLLAQRNFHERLPNSPERTFLERLNRQYLEAPSKYWSPEADAARVNAWRMRQPFLRRALYDLRQFLKKAHRFARGGN